MEAEKEKPVKSELSKNSSEIVNESVALDANNADRQNAISVERESSKPTEMACEDVENKMSVIVGTNEELSVLDNNSDVNSSLHPQATTCESLETSNDWLKQNSQALYTFNNVKVYFISASGEVETTGRDESLTIFKLQELVQVENTTLPDVFLQVGNWYYPLVKHVSPYYCDENRRYIFPDLLSHEGGSVALEIPEDLVDAFDIVLRSFLFDEEDEEEEEEEDENGRRGVRVRRSVSHYSSPMARKIVAGATYISDGLVRTAEGASRIMSQMTPHILQRITPDGTARNVSPNLSRGMEVTKTVTRSAASVTGFMVTQVGYATSALGNFLAPHVQKQGVRALSSVGMSENEASAKMSGAMEVAAGAVEGFSTIYSGLERFSVVLGGSLKDNTVKVVSHKYGSSVGNVTENTLTSMGSILQTASNMKVLTPRGALKKSMKDTGKAIISTYPASSNK